MERLMGTKWDWQTLLQVRQVMLDGVDLVQELAHLTIINNGLLLAPVKDSRFLVSP